MYLHQHCIRLAELHVFLTTVSCCSTMMAPMINGCLSCSNCKITEFKVCKKAGKVNRKVRTLDLWRRDF